MLVFVNKHNVIFYQKAILTIINLEKSLNHTGQKININFF